MNFNLSLNAEHINTLFAGLNKLEHGQARGTFDIVLQQVQAQEAAAKAPKAPVPEDTPVAGLSD